MARRAKSNARRNYMVRKDDGRVEDNSVAQGEDLHRAVPALLGVAAHAVNAENLEPIEVKQCKHRGASGQTRRARCC